MVNFKLNRTGVVLEYKATLQGSAWVWDELKKGEAEISQVFTFELQDLIDEPSEAQLEDS